MKVRELIEKLQELEQEQEILADSIEEDIDVNGANFYYIDLDIY